MSVIFDQVTYCYSSQDDRQPCTPALNDVSFQIEDGDFFGIIGHTGSGKSTLIQHINGLLLPSSGHVVVNGTDTLEGRSSRTAVREKVGIVFQYPEYQLFANTVFEDVAFGPRNIGLSETEVAQRVQGALARAGLESSSRVLQKSPFDFSGGQRRRIALAGVLAMNPSILVLDEPMAGLDPKGRTEIMGYIHALHEEGMTIVMVSHSMEDIAEHACHVLVLQQGHVFAQGTPEEIFSRTEQLREIGLGVPITTSFAQDLARHGFVFDRTTFTVDGLADAIASQLGGGDHA